MKVDVHTHFIPPQIIAEARQGSGPDRLSIEQRNGAEWMVHREGYHYPLGPQFWDVEAKLEHMDHLGLDVSILSIAPTLFFYNLDADSAWALARTANEAVAEMASRSEGRLYGMATVPLQDPPAAAHELRRAVQELGLRGVQIGTSMEARPLDDPAFEPFFQASEELGAPVVLHPYYVGPRPQLGDFYFTNLIGNPLETCLAAARLICSGFLDRHPELAMVLVHAGGFLPFQVGRLDHGFQVRPETRSRIERQPSSYLRRFYMDTITHASLPLRFLVDLMGADRVVLGTDIPFDMADLDFARHLSAVDVDNGAGQAIAGGNAARLFRLDGIG